jgi:hypothetical protein
MLLIFSISTLAGMPGFSAFKLLFAARCNLVAQRIRISASAAVVFGAQSVNRKSPLCLRHASETPQSRLRPGRPAS